MCRAFPWIRSQEPAVAPGLPAELLRRRPDILMAEANLAAASADTVVARAALYPSLNLTLQGGVANPAVNAAVNALAGIGPSSNLGAGLTQPLFDGGKFRSQSREAQAREQEAVTSYKSALIAALVDVENSFAAVRYLDEARERRMPTCRKAPAHTTRPGHATNMATVTFWLYSRGRSCSSPPGINTASTNSPACKRSCRLQSPRRRMAAADVAQNHAL